MLDHESKPGDHTDLVAVVAENIRKLREKRKISLSQLAQSAGIGKSTLSQLESGVGNPSIETLWAIASALGVPFHAIVTAARPKVCVVRAGGGIQIDAEEAAIHSHLLTSHTQRGTFEFYVIEAEPGRVHRARAHFKGSVEYIYLLRGRLRVGPADGQIELKPGDLAWFGADVEHVYEAVRKSRYVMIVAYA